jgi:hypothetical protein
VNLIWKILPVLSIILFESSFLEAQEVTWFQDIEPIIRENCQSCHRPGQIGPMPLTNYQEVAAYANMIAYVTEKRLMPPWLVEEPVGVFRQEKHLSEEEIFLFRQWMEQGTPKGKPENTSPSVPDRQKEQEIEEPDAVFSMAESFEQYGIYYDQYRVFVIPTDLKEEKWVEAVQFVPGNPRIVRNVTISVDTSDRVFPLDEWDPQYGYFSFGELGIVPMESRWYSWNPGKGATFFPSDYGLYLPPKARLLVHVHYGPTGVPAKDSSSIRLKWSRKIPPRRVQTAAFVNPFEMTNDTFLIRKGEMSRYHASFVVPEDIEVFGIYPHAHFLGKTWEIFAVPPDKKKAALLLRIGEWDFHWKQMFEFLEPKVLRKGTVVHAIATYDNTASNLFNPSDPPRTMHWGKRMYEEMFLVYFTYSVSSGGLANPSPVELLPVAPNQSSEELGFSIKIKKKGRYTGRIIHFNGTHQKEIFREVELKPGLFQYSVDLRKMKKGNYVLEITSDRQNEKIRLPFLYLGPHFLD